MYDDLEEVKSHQDHPEDSGHSGSSQASKDSQNSEKLASFWRTNFRDRFSWKTKRVLQQRARELKRKSKADDATINFKSNERGGSAEFQTPLASKVKNGAEAGNFNAEGKNEKLQMRLSLGNKDEDEESEKEKGFRIPSSFDPKERGKEKANNFQTDFTLKKEDEAEEKKEFRRDATFEMEKPQGDFSLSERRLNLDSKTMKNFKDNASSTLKEDDQDGSISRPKIEFHLNEGFDSLCRTNDFFLRSNLSRIPFELVHDRFHRTEGDSFRNPSWKTNQNLPGSSSSNSEDSSSRTDNLFQGNCPLKKEVFPDRQNRSFAKANASSTSSTTENLENDSTSINLQETRAHCSTPKRSLTSASPEEKRPFFNDLALNVSYSGLDVASPSLTREKSKLSFENEEIPEFWEDIGVVEYMDRRLGGRDESTPEERVEILREILEDTDLHEGDGDVSDFLFHVARTKYGKVYIRVIRTLLLNRVLCSNRVSQMTKTYNDIVAVTRLLEEKEKDLELTARIGKELLSHNQKLETTVHNLEAELKDANERITQLTHELTKKTELIQVLTNDAEESSSEAGTPTGLRGINLDIMQKKISSLEDENKQLRTEFSKLMHEADDSEEQEAKLVKDIAAQLASANMEVDGIVDELERQKEENRLQHEQIVSLTAKLAETELRLAQLMAEHDEVGATLVITRDNQNTLASELAEFKDRYAEVVNLLAETQEQLRKQRKRGMPTVRGGSLFPSMGAAAQPDSIASELESSLYSELSLDSGISADRMPTYKKVFETVRTASRSSYGQMDANQFPRLGSMTTSTLSTGSNGPRMSCGHIKPTASTFPSLDSAGHSDSEGSLITDSEDYPGPQQVGVPGAPGAADLEAALRRLTPAEVIARRACLSTGAGFSYDYDAGPNSPSTFVPLGCRTPDSIMSTGSSGNLSGFGTNSWRIPAKLQIVKPMEGSQTLHHWSQLATPTLGGLLEERPGVKTRGGRGLEDLGLVTFTLSDLEEDEEYMNPGKLFQDTGSIYTYTNSTVLHPDDHTSVTPSIVGSRVASAANSAMSSGMSTPRTLSRRNSTSTFSTTLGLAKMLNERGIKAVTSSSAGTPNTDKNFSPTATPCNSPDASPLGSRSSSPPPESSISMGLLSSGAELIKRTFGVEQHIKRKRKSGISRSDRKALTGIRLVEKLERIGIDTIMATTVGSSISPLALQGSLYTRRSMESPMAQLTFLRGSMSSSGSQEKLACSSSASSRHGSGSVKNLNDFNDSAKENVSLESKGEKSDSGRQRRSGIRATRPDLGQVTPAVTSAKESPTQSALGTISSLLFGRKGGLL